MLLLYPRTGLTQVSFQPYQTIVTGSWPEVVCINDVNNDGLNDVVLGTGYYFDPVNDYKIFVYLQNAFGSLSFPVIYSYAVAYNGIKTMTIADVNDDTRNDIIIGYGDSIAVLYQDFSGTMNSPISYFSGTGVYSLKTGDLNNDGLTDIAVSHWNTLTIRIFYQGTLGFTQAIYSKPAGGYDEIDVADVNNDGLDDVVFMAGQGGGGIHVFIQNSGGTLNSYVSYFTNPPNFSTLHGIGIGDLNNDGRNDVVASRGGNTPNANIVLWFQDTVTSQLQSPPVTVSAYDIPEPIEISDLNCDTKNEIIAVHGGWNKLSVYEQDSIGGYSSYKKFAIPYASHYKPHGLSIGDYNNDGSKDIAIADYNNGLILLRNSAIVSNYYQIDTLILRDTLLFNTFMDSTFFTDVIQSITDEYIITQYNYYAIYGSYATNEIITDTTFIKYANTCSGLSTDTVSSNYSTFITNLISADTLLLSTTIDSLKIPIPVVTIYPNPSEGIFLIQLTSLLSDRTSITVYNTLGQITGKFNYGDVKDQRELDLSGYRCGTYFVKIHTEAHDVESFHKIVITR